MTNKHTPGPWEVRPSSNRLNGAAWRDIVSMGTEFTGAYVGEALEQDAALIASAPDLLAERDRLRQVNAELVAALSRILYAISEPGIAESRGYIQSWLSGQPLTEKTAQRIFSTADKILKAGKPATTKEGE